jgi:hypothetical protein
MLGGYCETIINRYKNIDHGDGYNYDYNEISEYIRQYDNKYLNDNIYTVLHNKYVGDKPFNKQWWSFILCNIKHYIFLVSYINNIFNNFSIGEYIDNEKILEELYQTSPHSEYQYIFKNIDNGHVPSETFFDSFSQVSTRVRLFMLPNNKQLKSSKFVWLNKKNIKELCCLGQFEPTDSYILNKITTYLLGTDQINIDMFIDLVDNYLARDTYKSLSFYKIIQFYIKFLLDTKQNIKIEYIYKCIYNYMYDYYYDNYTRLDLTERICDYMIKNNIIIDVINNNIFSSSISKVQLLGYFYRNNINCFKKLCSDELLKVIIGNGTQFFDDDQDITNINFIKFIADDDLNKSLIDTTVYIECMNKISIDILNASPSLINHDLLEKVIFNSNIVLVKYLLENKCVITQEDILQTKSLNIIELYSKYNFYMTKDTLYKYTRIYKKKVTDLIKYSIFCNDSIEIQNTIINELELNKYEILLSTNKGVNRIYLKHALDNKEFIVTKYMLHLSHDENRSLLLDYYVDDNKDIKKSID